MKSFGRSILVSIFSTAVDFGTSILLVEAFQVNHELAVFIGTVIGFVLNFSLNRWWAFEAEDGPLGWQFVRVLPVQVGSSLFRPGIVYLFERYLELRYWIANLVAAAIVYLVWNYPMNRWFVFRKHRVQTTVRT